MITGSQHNEPLSHVLTLKAVQSQANRYLIAVYGPDYVYRAPETYVNLVERWMYSIVIGEIYHGDDVITRIEELAAQRQRQDREDLEVETPVIDRG